MLSRFSAFFGDDLALDLGTVSTLLGVAGAGLVLNEPSLIAFDRDQGCTREHFAVGHLASQMQGRTPDRVTVVRPVRDGVITDHELCATMLRGFLQKAPRRHAFHAWPVARPRVLAAAPCSITAVEKQALFDCTLRAGARQVLLMSKAKAAALGAGLAMAEPVASLICDIGGGVTEAAVLSMNEIVAAHSIRIGGEAMDLAIVDHLKRRHSLRVGLPAAERLRIDMGCAGEPYQHVDATPPQEVRGQDSVTGLPRRAAVACQEVRDALTGPLEQIVECIRVAIDGCSPNLAADLFDSGLVLTGGGSLLRGLDRWISERTGLPARVAPNALTAVAQGLLMSLSDPPRWRGSLESSDVAARFQRA